MKTCARLLVLMALLLGAGAATAAPPAGKLVRMGFLSPFQMDLERLKPALAERGYVEGKTVVFETRIGPLQRLDALAAEVVASRPDVIVGSTTASVAALQRAGGTAPVVMMWVSDPVGAGFVQSLARPGGRITGASDLQEATFRKMIEYAHAFAPAPRIGVLVSPDNPQHAKEAALLQAAAQTLGRAAVAYRARSAAELDPVFRSAAADGVRIMVIAAGFPFFPQRKAVVEAGFRHRLGVAGSWGPFARDGALFSYGLEPASHYRDVAGSIDRVVNGADPATVPVTQPSQFELLVNERSAERLGLPIPAEIGLGAEVVK